MVRRCSDQVAKTLLFVFNALFLVGGILMVALGLYQSLRDTNRNINEIIQGLDALNISVVIAGAIVIVISFLGCCGAIKESNCMITTFLVFLILILIAEAVLAGLAFKFKGEIKSFVEKNAHDAFKNNSHLWDTIQGDLECCGVNGAKDYNGKKLPDSCCVEHTTQCTVDNASKGCLPLIEEAVRKNYLAIGVAVIGVAFIEVLGIIFACCLRSAINERYQTV